MNPSDTAARCLSCGRVLVPDDSLFTLNIWRYARRCVDSDARPNVCEECDDREVEKFGRACDERAGRTEIT